MRAATTGCVLLMLLCGVFTAGNLWAGSITYTYDDAGRLIRVDYENCSTIIEYEYDASGNRLTKNVTTQGNQPPDTPANPWVPDQATAVALTVKLSWTGGDPCPADTVVYDVYLGDVNPPTTLVSPGQLETTFEPSGLLTADVTYYWRIVARDSALAESQGPVWSFTTTAAEVCAGDFDLDRDVDGVDRAIFAMEFGRTDCGGTCDGDFDSDNDVDQDDLAVFTVNFGRADCPLH